MMLRAVALLLVLLVAAPAAAVNRYVSTSGSATWANATNPATPASLSTANSSAVAGDVIHMSAGTYGTSISPTNSGASGNRIVFMGAAGDSSSVIVPGITLNGDDYITVKWMRCTGNASGTPIVSPRNYSSNDSLYFVRVLGSIDFTAADNITLAHCLIGLGGTIGIQVSFSLYEVPPEQSSHSNIMNDCVMYLSGTGHNAIPAIDDFGSRQFNISYMRSSTVERCRIFMWAPPGAHPSGVPPVPAIYGRIKNNTFTDCLFELDNDSDTDHAYLFMFRDSVRFNVWTRDTIRSAASSTRSVHVNFAASGSFNNRASNYANQYIACVFDVKNTDDLIHAQAVSVRSSFTGCIFDTYDGLIFEAPDDKDSLTFTHNTVVSYSGAPVVQFDDGMIGASVGHNIYYAAGSANTTIVEYSGPNAASNNNLYWSATPGDSVDSFVNVEVGPGSFPCTNWALECNSRFGNPSFADAPGGDFTPAVGGNAFGSWWPDGYVGAISDGSAPGGDVDPPGRVTDLSLADTGPTGANLSWTACGDDGFTGTADTVLVRRSASEINSESAWNNSTVVSSLSGGSQAPGGEQQSEFATGLSAGSTVFFAVRGKDEAGNLGSISNSPSITLPGAPDVTPPDPVANLTALALNESSIRLSWTSPGNDGATGTATNYRIKRRAGTTFVLADSGAATVVTPQFSPHVAGTTETMTIGGLSPSTAYAFALWTQDAAGNTSTISNAATATTSAAPSPPSPVAMNRRRGRR